MAKKLTLSIKESTIWKAKKYAQAHDTSLSMLVQQYFGYLTADTVKEEEGLSPLVSELTGMIELDQNFEMKQEYGKHLEEKYLK